MKRNLSKLIVTIAVSLVIMGVQAQADDGGCSNHTLHGDYAFRISGEVFTPAGIVNRDGVAMTYFDGNGGLTQVDWVMANGSVVPAQQLLWVPRRGNRILHRKSGLYR